MHLRKFRNETGTGMTGYWDREEGGRRPCTYSKEWRQDRSGE